MEQKSNEKLKTYTCAMCHQKFESERSDEEAAEELKENFGEIPLEDCDVICESCYQSITIGGKPINFN